MKTYEKYKSSKVECIGSVPEHWEVKKLKYETNLIIDGTHFTPTYLEEGVPFLRVTDIHSQNINLDGVKRISEKEHKELSKRCNPEKGDLLLSKNGTIGITKVINWDWEFSIFVSLCLIKFKETLDPHFFSYMFSSDATDEQINEGSKKTSVTNLHLDKIRELLVIVPPIAEQTAIAEYLDEKTAEIDKLIANKERLIELLKEERTAIINKAVTRGINADPKLKPSGIDWLGDIPEHWEVKKLKYVAYLKSGNTITSELIRDEGDFPVYGGNGLRGYFSSFTHEGDFVLIGRQGALCGNINYAFGKFWASEHAVVATLLNEKYQVFWLGELLRMMNLNQYSQSAAQPGLAVEMIKNLYIPVPSDSEQKEIVEFIESKTNEIDSTISKIEKEIELIKEYRTALISEVVTGKVCVIDNG